MSSQGAQHGRKEVCYAVIFDALNTFLNVYPQCGNPPGFENFILLQLLSASKKLWNIGVDAIG